MRVLMALASLLAALPCWANGMPGCSREMARRAESAASSAGTWQDLFNAYSFYRACDDAAIAEGFSDSTARLLSANGNTWEQLAAFVATDEAFLAFVVRHIDETVVPTTLEAIERNAKTRCPREASRICKAVLHGTAELRERATREGPGPKPGPVHPAK